ncbi:MAG: Hint domain-containing protein [Pseudomonadota bacterium]
MADNFNDPFAQNLIGLWDFLNSDPNGDTGLADGLAQDGTPENGASIAGGRLRLDGQNDRFDVDGNNGPNDVPFDLDEGTISVQFTQDKHVGTSPDTLVNRGEFNDASTEGFFAIQVTRDGKVQVQHIAGGESVLLSTEDDFFEPGDNVKATYSWDKDAGLTFTVENLTDNTSTTITDNTTGLDMEIGDNDDEIFTFGAREVDDGSYDHLFDGSIDYVAVYDRDIQNGPDGAVDGEESGERMELGYDDANAPTDQGGDKITDDGDLIFGNGGDDTINGAGGDDTIFGDDGSSQDRVLVRESFEWDKLPDPNGGGGIDDGDPLSGGSQDTGNVTVSYAVLSENGATTAFSTEEQNVDGIDDGPESIDDDSGLNSTLGGSDAGSASYELTFSDDVENVDFNVNDIDGSATVRITAFDSDGNAVPVVLTQGDGLDLVDANTVTTADLGEYDDPDSEDFSTNVAIAGPVARIVIEHSEGAFNSGIWVTDVYFDAADMDAAQPDGGDDVIIGGEGADVMFGEGGDDTFVVGSGAEGDGDVISGGAGPDDNTDNDVLDLRGAGDVVIDDTADANDAGATAGTVTFENGETLTFSGIETILFDENGTPIANDDDVTVAEDGAVTFDPTVNDTDPDGDPLEVDSFTQPSNGTVEENPDGTLTYTPDTDYFGDDSFTVTITDPDGETSTSTVNVTVEPVNDLPVAVDDVFDTDEDTPITFNPAQNDTDVESPTADLRVVDATVDPEFGTVEVDPDTGEVTFTPAENYNGPAPITYVVEDPDGGQDIGTALVNVAPVADAPEPQDDAAVTDQGTPVIISVLDNDSDPDTPLADLTVTAASVPAEQGTVSFDGTTVTFTPAPAFVGTATISYTITDPEGLSGSASISVDVTDVIGPVDGTDAGELMLPDDYVDLEGDQIDGTDGDDDTIFGNGGDDTIDGGDGDDTIDGGADNDDVTGADGDDSVLGGAGSDTLAGGVGEDTLKGGLGDDDIAVNDGDMAEGGSGDDVFTLDDSDPTSDIDAVTIDGGSDGTDGNPDDDANGNEGDVLDLGDVTEDLEVRFDDTDPEDGTVDGLDSDGAVDITFEEIEKVITGSGDDDVDGGDSDGPINVETGAGDDTITGTDGDDTIDSGDDDDEITTGDGSDSVDGGDGNNVIDTSGPSSIDPTDPEGKPDAGYPGLFVGDDDPENDKDTVTTGSGDDEITTGDDDDLINAGDGDNDIDAGFDDDTVITGDGDDTIVGGEGNDSIDAGDGDDLIFAGNDPSIPDAVNIPDDDLGSVNPLTPDLVPDNGLDTVSGGAGNDTIFGADDNDLLMGDEGDDVLNGGIDDDTLMGGTGDDVLIGGQGEDSMLGGDGEDTFIIADPDDPLYQAGSGIGDVVDGGAGGAPVADNTAAANEDWDVLDLRGSAPEGGSLQVTESGVDSNGNGFNGFVTYFDENGDEVGRLDFTEIEEVIPCFTPGTLIATPRGERRVEDLKVGDRVITRDNGIQEIRWVGHRAMTGEELARAPRFNPILIRAGALGRNLPERDMLVSPQHRMLMTGEKPSFFFDENEVLVAAKHLTHLDGVDEVEVSSTTYIHVMFDQHEVILSDGAWSESFQPGDMTLSAMGDAQRAEIFELFPELDTPDGIEAYTSARRALKKHEAKLLT